MSTPEVLRARLDEGIASVDAALAALEAAIGHLTEAELKFGIGSTQECASLAIVRAGLAKHSVEKALGQAASSKANAKEYQSRL